MYDLKYTMKDYISDFILGFIFTLFFLSIGVIFVVNFKPLYYLDVTLLNIEERSGLSRDIIKENYDTLIEYNSPFFTDELELPTLKSSDTGLQHFVEVKRIITSFYYLAAITGVLLIPFVIYKIRRDHSLRFFRSASAMILIIPIIVGIWFAVNFDQAFVTFHQIFFDNDYWIFSPETDPVITILPDTFFLHSAVVIMLVMLLGSFVLYLLFKWRRARILDSYLIK